MVDRGLFVRLLHRESRPACHTDGNGAPSVRSVGELARGITAGFRRNQRTVGSPKETGDLHACWNRNDKDIVKRHDHAGDAGKRAARLQTPARGFVYRIHAAEHEVLPAAGPERQRLGPSSRHIGVFEPALAEVAQQRHILRSKRPLGRRVMLDPGQRRQRRLAVRVNDGVTNSVELALSRGPSCIRTLLALFERANFSGFFTRLPGDETGESAKAEGECLEFPNRSIVACKRAAGPVADERHGSGRKLLA